MFSHIFLPVLPSATDVYKQGSPLANVDNRSCTAQFPEGELPVSVLEEDEKGSEDRITM